MILLENEICHEDTDSNSESVLWLVERCEIFVRWYCGLKILPASCINCLYFTILQSTDKKGNPFHSWLNFHQGIWDLESGKK